MRGTERIVRGVMDQWQAGIDGGTPATVAALFTEDAIFQGLRPYGVGRHTVADYYASQPEGMTVTYRILETRQPADGVVFGYLDAEFAFPDRPPVRATIGVLLTEGDAGWHVAHYQASAVAQRPDDFAD